MNYNKFTILVSASVPADSSSNQEKYPKIKHAQLQIEEAVVALARTVFQNGGNLILNGDASIAPLITMVATEYPINKGIENVEREETEQNLVNIYQSKVFNSILPAETDALFHLGYSNITWVQSSNNEKVNPKLPQNQQCKLSRDLLIKERLKSSIDALICIGGMEDVEREFQLFREFHFSRPIYVFKSTGGASQYIANTYPSVKGLKVIDQEETNSDSDSIPFKIIPFLFYSSLIVQEVINNLNDNNRMVSY